MIARVTPRLVLRPEHDAFDFLGANKQLFDAVLIPEGYLAEFPEGHTLRGKDHERLMRAAKETGRPVWRDPETPGLRSRTMLSLPSRDRRLLTPGARALDGKVLDLGLLSNAEFFEHFVDSCLEVQADSDVLAPPYLDFRGLDDPAHQLNLRMARRAVAVAADVPVTAFIQLTNYCLLRGVLAAAAPDYAATGVRHVITRVRELDAQTASRDELGAYLDAIDVFTDRGVEVTADCTGRLGPVLIAGGARGFSTGTRFFQKVPYALLSKREGGGGGEKIAHQAAGTWGAVPREEAGLSASEARIANLRTLREHMQLAASDPDALIASLAAATASYARDWAAVLSERRRRAA